MIIEIDTGKKLDLTGKQMAMFDASLRKKFANLIGWSYSPITGELTLDFGDDDEQQLISVLKSRLDVAKDEGKFLKADMLNQEWTNEDIRAT